MMRNVLSKDAGNEKMQEIADAVQVGAMAYIKRQFRTILVIVVPLALVVFFTSTAVLVRPTSAGLDRWQSGLYRTLAFLGGALFSGFTGFIGMWLATRANVRTAIGGPHRLDGRRHAGRLPGRRHRRPVHRRPRACSAPRSS